MRTLLLSAGLAGVLAGCRSPEPDYEKKFSILYSNYLVVKTEGSKNGRYYWDTKTYGSETPEFQEIKKQFPKRPEPAHPAYIIRSQ